MEMNKYRIDINIKQLGKRRNAVKQVPFYYDKEVHSLRELIGETVKLCVTAYIERMENPEETVLSEEEIREMAEVGKIAFGVVYGEKKPDLQKSIDTAIEAFEDGWFRVFLGEEEVTGLDEPLHIAKGEAVTFIRLTMLAGRIW